MVLSCKCLTSVRAWPNRAARKSVFHYVPFMVSVVRARAGVTARRAYLVITYTIEVPRKRASLSFYISIIVKVAYEPVLGYNFSYVFIYMECMASIVFCTSVL